MGLFNLNMQSSVLVTAPSDRVWQVFSDVPRWTQWSPVTLRSDVDAGFAWRPGEQLRLKLRMAGVGVPFDVRVTESAYPPPPRRGRDGERVTAGPPGPASAPPRRVAWASTELTVTAVRTLTFADTPNGTLVTDHKAFSSPILPIWLFYPRPVIRRMTESFLADLKAECERTT